MIRIILAFYRKLLYALCNRYEVAAMSPGLKCIVDDPSFEVTKGDVVHPCVRYIPEGFLGHKWWMTYTPYYNSNAKIENPILCYGDSNDYNAPIKWHFYCKIEDAHKEGYNSDPNILFYNGKLYVFWRENQTAKCKLHGISRLTHCVIITSYGISETSPPLLTAKQEDLDNEVSPSFISTIDGFNAYATSLKFFNNRIRRLPKVIKNPVLKFLLLIDLVGLRPIRKSYGLAVWKSQDLATPFKLQGVYRFENRNWLYHPWHLDIFEWEGERYAVVQSNQCNADVILAKETELNNFKFYNKPLMTNKACGKLGIYKPSALVVDGVFYLFYTAQDQYNRHLNNLYVTTCNFKTLLQAII